MVTNDPHIQKAVPPLKYFLILMQSYGNNT